MGTNEKNMTTGSPGKLIITFAIPLMLGNIFQQFYTILFSTVIIFRIVWFCFCTERHIITETDVIDTALF